jgi:AcrR family transcriptional regulator
MSETKGQATKNHILREGLMLASVKGLVNISIGGLAAKADMSRSGLFAHFLSKEQLQLEILDFANDLFDQVIGEPCRQIESPTEKVKFLINELPSWYEKTDPQVPGGCIFLTACLEFDDRPGRVQDYLRKQQSDFVNFLEGIYEEGVRRSEFAENYKKEDFAFTFYSMYMGYNKYKKFFGEEKARTFSDRQLSALITFITSANLSPDAVYAQ